MKQLAKRILGSKLQYIRVTRALASVMVKGFGQYDRECPLCGYKGKFLAEIHFPDVFRFDALCPKCTSLGRNRLMWLAITRNALILPTDAVLHFAPEKSVTKQVRALAGSYKTCDLMEPAVDLKINIEHIDLPDASVDVVICSHVLEHVRDDLAIAELYRILRPGGRLLAMVPIVEGWEKSDENTNNFDGPMRRLHFGRNDHVRRYGADFVQRLAQPGFKVDALGFDGTESVRFGLLLGEKLFVARKAVEVVQEGPAVLAKAKAVA